MISSFWHHDSLLEAIFIANIFRSFFNFFWILLAKNLVPLGTFLFVLEQALFENIFCSIWNIFCSWFYAKKKEKKINRSTTKLFSGPLSWGRGQKCLINSRFKMTNSALNTPTYRVSILIRSHLPHWTDKSENSHLWEVYDVFNHQKSKSAGIQN